MIIKHKNIKIAKKLKSLKLVKSLFVNNANKVKLKVKRVVIPVDNKITSPENLFNAVYVPAKKDIENIIKYLFVLGDCGECNSIKKLTTEETLQLYTNIGKKLNFDSIIT